MLKKLFATIVIFMGCNYGYSADFFKDGNYYKLTDHMQKKVMITHGAMEENTNLPIPSTNGDIPSKVKFEGEEYEVVGVGAKAFYGSGIKHVNIPETVTFIEEYAFAHCLKLEEVYIPENVQAVGYSAFMSCPKMKKVKWDASEQNIPFSCFAFCYKLESAEFKRITSIGSEAFMSCLSLKNAPTQDVFLRDIGNSAFFDCKSLTSLEFSLSIRDIGEFSFSGCPDIKEIKCETFNPPHVGLGAFDDNVFNNSVLSVYEPSAEKYRQTSPWSKFKKIESIKGVDDLIRE